MNAQLQNQTQYTYTNELINNIGLEKYHQIIAAFKNKAKKEGLNSSEHILYNRVRNMPEDRGFSPMKNPIKLANGYEPMSKFKFGTSSLNFQLQYKFAELVSTFNLPIDSKDYWLIK